MEPLLRIRGLDADYGAEPVLRALDLDVPAGQLLCVLGPSGGGKSTLLRVIAGLEQPTHGSIELAGRDLAGVEAHEREVGLMFQDYALFPHRDVGDNVGFGLRMRKQSASASRARVSELLQLVGLPGAERRAVSQLSGGEQQRVALARALAPQPRLLMLDEPMGSLDRSLRERLPEELRAIFSGLGVTVIYVTHDQDEALTVADRVVLLDAGRVIADGSPEELWTRPPTTWTARFLGFRNIAPAELDDARLRTPWGALSLAALDPAARASVSEGSVDAVLRAASLTPVHDGPIKGIVSSRQFRGDHVLLTVTVGEAPALYVEARDDALPTVGDPLQLDVRPGSVHVIAAQRTLPSES